MRIRIVISLLLSIAVVGLAACQPAATPSGKLTVFAASSLSDAFDEIAAAFKADHPGVEVALNYGGSSQLATQIKEGGPADVFASASPQALQTLVDAGYITQKPLEFASNRLVIVVPRANPAHLAGLKDLANPGIRLVLAVKGVPIRDYADQIIAKASAGGSFGAGFPQAVYANVVSEEDNVRQVVSKIALGEADAGIVYVTDVTPQMADKLLKIDIPADLNVTAAYPIAAIASSKQPELAQAFVAFVAGEKGQAILARWGFGPAPNR